MVFAQVNGGVFQLLLILHILSVIVAFAPSVVHPLVGNRLQADQGAARSFASAAAANGRTVYLPALVLVGVLGFALVGASDGVYAFSEPWVSIAAVLWLAIGGIVGAVVLPGERLVAAGDAGALAKVRAGGAMVSVLLLVVLFLMVVKPG